MAKQLRGFAIISPERQREIARMGGKAAHEQGKAHEWTPEEAAQAGKKGGATAAVGKKARAARGR